MADAGGGATKEIQERIERLTKLISSLQITAFQLANFYFASQAVVFTALTGDSTSLVCRDLWFPMVLSLVPAVLNITALSVIGWNLVNAIGDRLKIIRELSTYHDRSNTLQPSRPTQTLTVAPGTTATTAPTGPPQTRTLTTEEQMPPALPLYPLPTHTLTTTAAVHDTTTAAVPETTTLPLQTLPTQTLTTTATPMPLALPPQPAGVPGTMTTAPGTTALPTGDLSSLKIRHTICFCACMIIFAIFAIVLAVGSWWMLCREQNFLKHHDDDGDDDATKC
ncbi:hypothetical protein RHMOL_Rhmol02G0027300 [Rhododendron molle]|uniref:Uncharacterized protein n=1 Tax=Rhododendron molle TaxID=49168 RepID=A0ACC0PP39_RHOML|nr:hypothetical protein RHMOL_Rhmol02G0027300 [Rhododendron molle]